MLQQQRYFTRNLQQTVAGKSQIKARVWLADTLWNWTRLRGKERLHYGTHSDRFNAMNKLVAREHGTTEKDMTQGRSAPLLEIFLPGRSFASTRWTSWAVSGDTTKIHTQSGRVHWSTCTRHPSHQPRQWWYYSSSDRIRVVAFSNSITWYYSSSDIIGIVSPPEGDTIRVVILFETVILFGNLR